MAENEKDQQKKPIQCTFCEASFGTKKALRRHKLAIHVERKPFECAVCNKGYNHEGDLKRHISSVHEGKKPFRCEICDNSFSLKGDWKRHVTYAILAAIFVKKDLLKKQS